MGSSSVLFLFEKKKKKNLVTDRSQKITAYGPNPDLCVFINEVLLSGGHNFCVVAGFVTS